MDSKKTTLQVGDLVAVSTLGYSGSVGRVVSTPVSGRTGRPEVVGTSLLGPFRRQFKREDLTRLVPETANHTGYDPYTLDNDDLQLAIDNALQVLKEGPGFDVDDSRVVRCLLEDHLNDLLEIQRERAGGEP